MKAFTCQVCRQLVFFENIQCLRTLLDICPMLGF